MRRLIESKKNIAYELIGSIQVLPEQGEHQAGIRCF